MVFIIVKIDVVYHFRFKNILYEHCINEVVKSICNWYKAKSNVNYYIINFKFNDGNDDMFI